MKGYCGNNKRKIERKTTTITKQHVTIKNQILNDKISNQYMQSLLKRDFQEYFDRLEKSYSYEIARRKEEIEEFGQNDGNFKIAKYLKQNVNLWTGEIKEVKLLCNNSIMNHVKMKFGRDIWMKMLENGTFETRVAVADSK